MKQKNNMKEFIQSEATKLIITNGVKNTSLADISKACGISKGTLYYHYSSKDDLICDIATNHLKVITDSVIECIQSIENSESDKMIILILEKIADIKVRGRIHMYLLCEAITSNDKLKNKIKANYSDWRASLKKELMKTTNDNEKSDALSCLLVSIVDGLVIQGVLSEENIPFENIANVLVDKFI